MPQLGPRPISTRQEILACSFQGLATNPLDDKSHLEVISGDQQVKHHKGSLKTIVRLLKTRWIQCAGITGILAILAAVLGGILGTRHKKSAAAISVKVCHY